MRLLKSITSLILISFIPIISTTASTANDCWVHLVDILDPIPLEEIIKRYSAYDYIDGDLSNNLAFTTDYCHTTCEVGKYELIVTIENSKNNKTTHNDLIIVRDFISPTITSTITELHIEINDILDESNILAYLNYYDNLDDDLKLIIENFPTDTSIEGIYDLKIYCVDSSTNISNIINITLYIEDYRDKEISNYTLTTNKLLSKDKIIDILKENYIIPPNYKNIEIISDFLNESPKHGIFPAEAKIILEDDSIKIIYFKIEYIKLKEKSNTWIIYTFIGLTIFTTLFIIIYKKRAQ